MKTAMGLAAMVLLVSASRPPVIQTERNVRQERCDLLLDQLDKASRSSVTYQDAKSVDRLRKRAIYLCNRNKESQGVRAFAKALAILGLRPVDTTKQQITRKP
ncbi:hypothetical protein [Rhizobium sp.]